MEPDPQPRSATTGFVRRLWVADKPMFRAHLLRLDPQSRLDRFGAAVSESFLNDYAERCFEMDDVIYGFVDDDEVRGAGELRGIGRHLPFAVGGSAEAAFSVEIPWRRRGIAGELGTRIIRAARNRRTDTLYMTCLMTNEAMLRLARKFTPDLRAEPEATDPRVYPAPPTPETLFEEAADDMASFATAMVDLHRRRSSPN
jgi:RimJ/RimL family protein N-acetyltransferase